MHPWRPSRRWEFTFASLCGSWQLAACSLTCHFDLCQTAYTGVDFDCLQPTFHTSHSRTRHTHERALLSHGEFTCLLILYVPQAHHRRRRSLRLWHSGTATSPRLHRLRLTWYADSPELQTRLPSHCTPPPPAHAHACRATRTLHTDEVPTVVRADGSWHCWRCTSSFSLLGTLNALRPYHDKPLSACSWLTADLGDSGCASAASENLETAEPGLRDTGSCHHGPPGMQDTRLHVAVGPLWEMPPARAILRRPALTNHRRNRRPDGSHPHTHACMLWHLRTLPHS